MCPAACCFAAPVGERIVELLGVAGVGERGGAGVCVRGDELGGLLLASFSCPCHCDGFYYQKAHVL